MTSRSPDSSAAPPRDAGAAARLLAAEPGLRRAARLAGIGALLWIPQAALIAHMVAGFIAGGAAPVWPAAGLVLLAVLRAGLDWIAQGRAQQAARRITADLRREALDLALSRAPGGTGEDAGGLASLIGEKLALVGPWAERWPLVMARLRLAPLAILAVVAVQSWSLALALAVTGPLIPVFMILIGHAAQSVSRVRLVEAGDLNRLLLDRIGALADIRLLGAGPQVTADLAQRFADLRDRTMAVLRLAFLSSAVLEFMAALGVALVAVQVGLSLLGYVAWGGWGGPITPFGGILVLLLAPDFYQPFRDMAAAWHDRAAAAAALEEMEAFRAAPVVLIPGGIAVAAPAPAAELRWRGLVLQPGPDRQIPVTDGRVAPGEAVALVAPSGAGKSSLLAALAGLSTPPRGRVALGDLDLDAANAPAIRAALGWLPQQPRFPAMSLRRWLTEGGSHSDAEIAAALRGARADGIVAGLPGGLDARLGEGGGGVSGGEARRLMIARALLAPPAILLADEPTADLDPETAAAVRAALLALRDRGAGLLVATHDPALAAAMDRRIGLEVAA